MDSHPPDSSRRLIDQSKLLRKRARRRIEESEKLVQRAHHNWHQIAAGRVCSLCMTAQAPDEYDDTIPCEPRAAS